MKIWRKWILPIVFILIFAAIAVSLTKLAFFAEPEEPTIVPGGEVTDPVIEVELGSIVNELSLQAKIARDAEVIVRSPHAGTVREVFVSAGSDVSSGQVLFTIRTFSPERTFEVVAPEAGTLKQFDVVAGQDLAVGGEFARLSPARYHVLATVEPVMLYRLLNAPSEAEVTIPGGPAPFTCTGLATQVAEDGTTSVRCAVPGDQVVFPGLPVALRIAVGTAENVLTIPTTAVKGGSGSGIVWLESADGEATETTVELGVSDGSRVEVINGLKEGDRIREFVPGVAAPAEEFCYEVAPGEEICETGVNW